MKSSSSVYFSRLDHLRFLAALMVLAWHALHYGAKVPFTTVPKYFPFSWLEEGHTGVALFLTLSGFLFAALTDDKDVDYGGFVRNRLQRIAPLFVVWTLVAFYTSQVLPERLFAVIFGLLDRNYYPSAGWTVLVEFQLYLVFPFLLRFWREYGHRYLLGVVAVCALIRLLTWLHFGHAQFLAYWTVFGRADQFILGMLAFAAYKRYSGVLGHPLTFIAGFVALSFAYDVFNRRGGYYHFDGNTGIAFVWVYLPTLEGLGYGFLIASYLAWRVPIPKPVDRLLAWLGALSYSLYLNHPFVVESCFRLANRYKIPLNNLEQYSAFTFLAVLPALIACSALTYYVIELPFLRMRRSYTVPRLRPGS